MSARSVGPAMLASSDIRVPVRTGSTASDLTDIIIARTTDTAIARIISTVAVTAAPVGVACGHLTGGAASGCAVTGVHPTDIDTISVRTTDIATDNIIVHTTDMGTAVAEY
jgi:hypothetical protein